MESTTYTIDGKEFELKHYGVKGMRWGHRKKQSRYERAADRAQRDADDLRKHGYTAEADAVQRVADKNRQKAIRKAEKKQFKADVKDFRKNGFELDYEIDAKTGQFTVTQYYNSKRQKIGKEYADRILAQVQKENVRAVYGTYAAMLGAAVVASMLESR